MATAPPRRRLSYRTAKAEVPAGGRQGSPPGVRLQKILPQFRRQDIDAALRDSNGHVSTAVEKLLHSPDVLPTDGSVQLESAPGQIVMRQSLDAPVSSNGRHWAPAKARSSSQQQSVPDDLRTGFGGSRRFVASRRCLAEEEEELSSASTQANWLQQRLQAIRGLAARRNNSPTAVTPVSKAGHVAADESPLNMELAIRSAREHPRSEGARLFRRRDDQEQRPPRSRSANKDVEEQSPATTSLPKRRWAFRYQDKPPVEAPAPARRWTGFSSEDDQADLEAVQQLMGGSSGMTMTKSTSATFSVTRHYSASDAPPPEARLRAPALGRCKSARPALEPRDAERVGPAVVPSPEKLLKKKVRPATAHEERSSHELVVAPRTLRRHITSPETESNERTAFATAAPEAPGRPQRQSRLRSTSPNERQRASEIVPVQRLQLRARALAAAEGNDGSTRLQSRASQVPRTSSTRLAPQRSQTEAYLETSRADEAGGAVAEGGPRRLRWREQQFQQRPREEAARLADGARGGSAKAADATGASAPAPARGRGRAADATGASATAPARGRGRATREWSPSRQPPPSRPQAASRMQQPDSADAAAGCAQKPAGGDSRGEVSLAVPVEQPRRAAPLREVSLALPAEQQAEAQGVLTTLVTSHESVEEFGLFNGLAEAIRQSNGSEEAVKVEQREREDFHYTFCATESRRLLLMHVPGTRGILRHFIQGVAIADTLVIALPSRESLLRDDSWLFERALIARGMGISKLTFAVVEDGPLLQTQFQKTMDFVKAQLAANTITCTMPATFVPTVKAGGATPGLMSPIWYRGKTVLQVLEGMQASLQMKTSAQLRVWLLDAHKDQRNVSLVGRVLQGSIERGTQCSLHPWRRNLQVVKVCDAHTGVEIEHGTSTDCVKIIVAPSTSQASSRDDGGGNSLVDPQALVPSRVGSSALWGVHNVEADRWLIDLRVVDVSGNNAERVEITSNFRGTLYFGCQVLAVNILTFVEAFDLDTQRRVAAPRTAKPGLLTQCIVSLREPAALDVFNGGRLGRFVLRRMGMTFGVGRVIQPVVDDH